MLSHAILSHTRVYALLRSVFHHCSEAHVICYTNFVEPRYKFGGEDASAHPVLSARMVVDAAPFAVHGFVTYR